MTFKDNSNFHGSLGIELPEFYRQMNKHDLAIFSFNYSQVAGNANGDSYEYQQHTFIKHYI